jgi:septation ring formation regulator EzrA
MSWANKVHMEQLAWTLHHHIGEGWMGSSYHLSMSTRSTHQLFLKPQLWQSSDQIKFTQVRQKLEAQVTQLPMPLPQLTRRTSQEATLNARRLRKISSKHLILRNDHTDNVPSRIQNPRTNRPKQHLKTLIPLAGTRKANGIQVIEQE